MSAGRDEHRLLLQRALTTVERLQHRLDEAERALVEPIAIIGMACRFPGSVDTPEAFWTLLHDGVDAITEVPAERWDVDAYFDPDPDAPGKSYTRWGGFLDGIDRFDAAFFGNAPREAIAMDPQHRLLLEVAWESLERAGQAPDQVTGSRTGVFIGLAAMDYAYLQMRRGELRDLDLYFGTGTSHSQAAGRLSYALDLRGPSVAVDTACSSSLLAVHLACHSLRARECDMAIGGGVNVMLCPDGSVATSRARMMSFTGRCHTFDAAADGYVRAEGCGLVVLKRLADAVANGDTVLAVIHGTASNQDGRSNGLTAPNPQAQERVIRAALTEARVDPREVSYVEAHGTGTTLGDPIEMRALGAVFGPGRPGTQPLAVGSVKTNIGHTEAAAGIAGLIKVVLALQHRTIPPHLHFNQPNPYIEWQRWPVVVPTSPMDWVAAGEGTRRVAGLSSFGFSGTNVHMVIAEPPPVVTTVEKTDRRHHVLPLSAKTPSALAALVESYATRLATSDPAEFKDICYTAGAGRSHFSERLATVADGPSAAVTALREWQAGRATDQVRAGTWRGPDAPNLVFLFTGQGCQYEGMGADIYRTEPVFREALDRCDVILRPWLERPLLDVVFPARDGDSALINQTQYTQPALFAFEYALSRLWRSWGVTPTAVMGHSVGEYVAACVAGVFSLEDGLRLIAARGALMQALPSGGTMVAVRAGVERVVSALTEVASTVSIAAVNGPRSTVISGLAADVSRVVASLESDGIPSTALTVSHAFHSPLMEPMLAAFREVAASVSFSPPALDFVSNLTGLSEESAMTSPEYWMRHIRMPVQFERSITTLRQQGHRRFLEIGPAPVLLGMAAQCVSDDSLTWIPSIRRETDDTRPLAAAVATLYASGSPIDWSAYHKPWPRRRLVQPTYPFERQRFWFELPERSARAAIARGDEHPLLGSRIRGPQSPALVFQRLVTAESPVLLGDHRLFDMVVMPGAAYIEMALAAGQAAGTGPWELQDVMILSPLSLPAGAVRILHLSLAIDETGEGAFEIQSAPHDQDRETWTVHATGRLGRIRVPPAASASSVADARARCHATVDPAVYYGTLRDIGVAFGPAFQRLGEIQRRDGEVVARVAMPASIDPADRLYQLDPTVLDACLQALGIALPRAVADGEHDIYLPVGLERLQVYRQLAGDMWCVGRVVGTPAPGAQSVVTEFQLFGADGQLLVAGSGVRFKRASREALLAGRMAPLVEDWLYHLAWQERDLPASIAATDERWLVFADDDRCAEHLVRTISARGGHVTTVRAGSSFEHDGSQCRVRPGVADDIERVLAIAPAGRSIHIVYLWALGTSTPTTSECTLSVETLNRISVAPLQIVRAVAVRGAATTRLLLVTQGSQMPGGRVVERAIQAPLWGLARVVHAELPDLDCRMVDLDPDMTTEAKAACIVGEFCHAEQAEWQSGYRGATRYVPRLRHVQHDRGRARISVRSDATYLVTGGLGGLGLVIARWLADRGAGTIVLFGRTPPGAEAEVAIADMRRSGVDVRVSLGDVRLRDDLRRAIDEGGGTGRLRGVIHAAGVLEDALLAGQSAPGFERVMGPKIEGAWNLHALTEALDLDFFVMCSAAATLFGSPGQANYASANAFLDALAGVRRARGLAAVSVAWGAWADVGMAARLGGRERGRWAASGVGLIDPARGILALEHALESDAAYLAVVPIDWRVFAAGENSPSRLVAELVTPAAKPSSSPEASDLVVDHLTSAHPLERRELLEAWVRGHVVSVLGLNPSSPPRTDAGLTELGMDSLMAVEVASRLKTGLGRPLPATAAFEHGSIAALTDHIWTLLPAAVTVEASTIADAVPEAVASDAAWRDEVDQLSDDEVMRSLEAELDRTGY